MRVQNTAFANLDIFPDYGVSGTPAPSLALGATTACA